MKKAYIKCPGVWTEFTAVNDGNKYRIQNTGDRKIWWSVGDKPDESERDGTLPPDCVLNFQKVSKNLYVKDFELSTPSFLYAWKVEEV